MIKEIKAYLTTDGSLFINELDAYKHECFYLQNVVDSGKLRKNVDNNKQNCGFFTCNGIEVKPISVYNIDRLKTHLVHPAHAPGIYMWFHIPTSKGYVGSAEDLFRRCSDFLRTETKYANEEIDKIRKNDLDNFVYFILEYVEDIQDLTERENYYINYYDTIKNGFNNRLALERPLKTKLTDEEKKERERLKYAMGTFETLKKYIYEWGMKLGNTLTLEKWANIYKLDQTVQPNCFRISCFMQNKEIVEFDDLLPLGNTIKMLIDKPHYGYRTETDAFPSAMIRYRQSDKKYLSIGNDSKTFLNAKDALIYHVNERIRYKLIDLLDSKYNCDEKIKSKVSYFLKECSIEDVIKLKYKDSEKIINFLDNQEKQRCNEEDFIIAEVAAN